MKRGKTYGVPAFPSDTPTKKRKKNAEDSLAPERDRPFRRRCRRYRGPPRGYRPAVVPVIWDGKKMYETFKAQGAGFSYPGPADRPVAYVAIDPQCPDCMKFTENVKPLLSKVNVIFFPIAFLNINSEPQGSTILASKEPWKKYDEQHEHFRDPEFRGIRYDLAKLPDDLRNKVWTNTKLHRRAGCRAVPYGVFKNSKGEYKPFDENLSTEELAALFEVKL